MSMIGLALPDLAVRRRQAELMDDPALDPSRHAQALRALRRINRVSFTADRVWLEVRRVHARLDRPIRVLDLACGGGDVLLDVARRARKAAVPVELHGADVSPVAVQQARRQAAREAAVDVFELDVLSHPIPSGYDLITTSLFLHHLERNEAVDLLRRMADATESSLLVQDLRRTQLGYVFAWVGLHTLTSSDVARVDGLISVRSAFTTREVDDMCGDAGLAEAEVGRGWPQRFVIRWAKR